MSRMTRDGFTTNEIGPVVVVMIVLLIVGIWAFVSREPEPSVGDPREQEMLVATSRLIMNGLTYAITEYHKDTGEYPQQLDDLVTDPGVPGWRRAVVYFDGVLPKDAWGHDFIYDPPKRGDEPPQPGELPYRIRCLGADGREGGDGFNADFATETE